MALHHCKSCQRLLDALISSDLPGHTVSLLSPGRYWNRCPSSLPTLATFTFLSFVEPFTTGGKVFESIICKSWHRQQKTIEIGGGGGGHMTMNNLFQKYSEVMHFWGHLVAKTTTQSYKNIFTALYEFRFQLSLPGLSYLLFSPIVTKLIWI